MRMRSIFTVTLLTAAAARASNVSNQISVNNTQETATNPRSGNVSDNLSASFDLSDKWSLDAGITLTAESATPAATRGGFGTSGSLLTMLSAGVNFDATDNWSLSLDGNFAPQSTQSVGTEISIGTATGQALVTSQSSEVDGTAEVSYDTAGDSGLEWNFSLGLSGEHQAIDQAITRARVGTLTLAQIKALCAAQPKRKVCEALRDRTAVTLDSEKLSLAATSTIANDTDVTLSGDLYHYEQDPAEVAYPSVVAARLGTGMPIAPLQYLIRAEVAHRFGDFMAKLYAQGGKYETGTGADNTKAIGLKLQYKFTKTFKLWLSASGQTDSSEPDPQGGSTPPDSKSSTIALGGQYRF